MIEIYGKDACPFCVQAKQLCEMKGVDYVYKNLGQDFTRDELLEKFPQARTFPQITTNNYYIGGYTELKEYLNQ